MKYRLWKKEREILKDFASKLPHAYNTRIVGKPILGAELLKLHEKNEVTLKMKPSEIQEDMYYKIKNREFFYINHFKELEKRFKEKGMECLLEYKIFLDQLEKKMKARFPFLYAPPAFENANTEPNLASLADIGQSLQSQEAVTEEDI